MARSPVPRVRAVALFMLPPVVAALATTALGYGLAEWVFFTVCLAAVTTACWLVRRAATRSARERERAAALAMASPDLAVHAAVVAERTRLSADISAELQSLLLSVRDLAATGDPGTATQIHRLTRQAVSELRRQLGLLRDPLAPPEPAPRAAPAVRIRVADLALASGVAALAGTEAWWHPRSEGLVPQTGSMAITVLAALPLVVARRSPAAAAAAVGAVQLVGLVIGVPVVHGFWILAAVGVPLWLLLARPPRGRDLAAAGLLIVGTVATGAITSRDDLGVLLGVLLLAVGGGLLVGRWQRRETLSRSAADRRAAELAATAAAAVEAHRLAYAREIHDTVSHAVGVIALQASVAQVGGPAAAGAALTMIHEVSCAALAELAAEDRDPVVVTTHSIRAVVDRMRAAGLSVTVTGLDDLPPDRTGLACRIIQEGLTNVARHAPGARAEVAVRTEVETVVIDVVDDGPGAVSRAPGHGLIGLHERVGDVGGSLELESRPGGGCRLRACLPGAVVEAR